MKRLAGIVIVAVCLLGVRPIQGQQGAVPPAAREAADSWLALVDVNNFAASWQSASTAFRTAITREKWGEALQAGRKPLGALKMRTLKAATPTKTVPGAPDGEYVVFQFDASYEQKQALVETVTTIRESDGTWRVAGYFIG
jgi:hypothetical protein